MIGDPLAIWKLAVAAQETACASWLTINQRMWRLATGHKSTASETWRMVSEKQTAFVQANWALQQQILRHWQRWPAPLEFVDVMTDAATAALRPYRTRSRANARRLARP